MIVRSTEEVEEQIERAHAVIRRESEEGGTPLKVHMALGMVMALAWLLDSRDEDPTANLLED